MEFRVWHGLPRRSFRWLGLLPVLVSPFTGRSALHASQPVGPAPTGCSNEPSGLKTLSNQPWDAVPPRGRDGKDSNGWAVTGGIGQLRIEEDPAAPASPPNVLIGRFPKGMKGGGGPFHVELTTEPVTELYQCFWLKLDEHFTNNGNVGTKLLFVWSPQRETKGDREGNAHYYLALFGGKDDRGNMGLNISAPGGEINRDLHTRFRWPGNFDSWHKFEVLTVANSAGQSDGKVRFWVDGQIDIQADNVRFFPGARESPGWNFLDLTPTYGGGHNPVPDSFFLRVDHWYVSGR